MTEEGNKEFYFISLKNQGASKCAYTLQKIFHGTENFPRTACAVGFFP